jgi:SSS family solute:Na+ symporter
MVYIILVLYLAFTFLGSLYTNRNREETPESYFLANRNLRTLTLFFTIIATNFSAFYFLGFAGEGYRTGYAYYVIMAFGTAFACLSFFFIGIPVWKFGKEHGYITPAELVYGQTGSKLLRWLFVLVMIFFTFPYLALQLIGAGYILESITSGDIPYFLGATLLTLFTIAYVLIGGMRSIASTDMKQGILMIMLMFVAVLVISKKLGGFIAANEGVMDLLPELFNREGAHAKYTPQKWFSLLVFWIFCIPMFPQIFMRFFIAKNVQILKNSAILYALVPLIISIFPVIIGVLGHLSFPGLEGAEADQILPKMLMLHGHPWFVALVMTGALAAFMSTLDSQLLALSTIVTRDIYLPFFRKEARLKRQVKVGRIVVIFFALVGLGIAYQPFDTIFDMGKVAFSGLATLFPATIAVIYFKRIPALFLNISVFLPVLILFGFYYGMIPQHWTLGFEPVLPALCLSSLVLIAGQLLYIRKAV